MIYSQQQPHENLRECVRCYWKIENNHSDIQKYTILPDGFFDLIICFHEDKLDRLFLTGLYDHKTIVGIAPGTTLYGIQFRLLAIETIIQESISAFVNRIQQVENSYLGLDTPHENDASSFFEHLNRCLLASIGGQKPIDSRKSVLLKTINETKGTKTVTYYARKANWSPRQINRYFRSTFGLSLKSYCGIRKCAATFSEIRKGQLFPQEGYFDQPHFIKEIKKITAFTPKVLLQNENDRFLQFSIIKNK